MTKQELEKLKKSLLEEKAAIEEQLANFATKNPVVKGDYKTHFHKSDPSDTLDEKAHSVTEFEGEEAVTQNLEVRLKDINETLSKMAEGDYGVCAKCSSPIAPKRLRAMPVAKLCLDCAKKAILL